MNLRVKSQTATAVVLQWDAVPDVVGFVFFRDDVVVSNSMNAAQRSVTFSKPAGGGSHRYKVQALTWVDEEMVVVP